MRRLLLSLAAMSVVTGFIATPNASAQQSVNFFLGGFVPTSNDARDNNDVLVHDQSFLSFRTDRFTGPTIGGEYLVGLSDFFEAGASLGFYQRTVPAADTFNTFPSGANVIADLKLRVVPFNATFRVLPFGHRSPIVPYVGAGLGVFGWRYSESGQFVDPGDKSIFNQTYLASGSATGPVVLGGVRVPMGPLAPGFEMRWQSAKGNLPTDPLTGFSGSKIDLGGISYLFTFNVRF